MEFTRIETLRVVALLSCKKQINRLHRLWPTKAEITLPKLYMKGHQAKVADIATIS